MVAAVHTVDSIVLLDMNEDDVWEGDDADWLDTVEWHGVDSKLRELLEMCRAKRQKDWTSVAEAFTLANELPVSVGAHTSIAERATRQIFKEAHKA